MKVYEEILQSLLLYSSPIPPFVNYCLSSLSIGANLFLNNLKLPELKSTRMYFGKFKFSNEIINPTVPLGLSLAIHIIKH